MFQYLSDLFLGNTKKLDKLNGSPFLGSNVWRDTDWLFILIPQKLYSGTFGFNDLMILKQGEEIPSTGNMVLFSQILARTHML